MTTAAQDKSWLVVYFLEIRSLVIPNGRFALGAAEICDASELIPAAESALQRSIGFYDHAKIEGRRRIRQTVEAPNAFEALRVGWLRSRELVSLFLLLLPDAAFVEVLPAGCAVDLETGAATAYEPRVAELIAVDPMVVDRSRWVVDEIATRPESAGELGAALARSCHWTRLARQTDDDGERCLLNWIAGETIARITDDDDVVPRFMAAMALPTGSFLKEVSAEVKREFGLRMGARRDEVSQALQLFKQQRNAVVHEGAREIEMRRSLGREARRLFREAVPFAAKSVQQAAISGFAQGIRTKRELWDRPECFWGGGGSSLLEKARNTILLLYPQDRRT